MASARLEYRSTQRQQWRQLAGGGRLYTVVETCGQKSVREKAAEVGRARAVSLFEGTYEAQYERSAPFFFHTDESIFDWIVESFWGGSWGILIWSDAGFEPVRAHLHRFLRVRGPDQSQHLFRFYDPYILDAFLKSCNDAELEQFFGPVAAFGANRGTEVMLFRRNPPQSA